MLQSTNHRAVEPIIATLLVVAITVVGGILVFVFTQSFFSEEQIVGPTFDNLEIFGYNAQDLAVNGHNGEALFCGSAPPASNDMTDGDCLMIFVTNKGDKSATIDKVRVFGSTYSQNSGGNGSCQTTEGSFSIHEGDSLTDTVIVTPNTDASVCVVYDADGKTGVIKIGRTIPVQIQTSNGQVSQINIVNGASRACPCV